MKIDDLPKILRTLKRGQSVDLLSSYMAILGEIDAEIVAARQPAAPPQTSVGFVKIHNYSENFLKPKGCPQCCHGGIRISLFDALLLFRDLKQRDDLRRRGHERTIRIVRSLQNSCRIAYPFLIESKDSIIDPAKLSEPASAPCPLLDGYGNCAAFDLRPLTCRLRLMGMSSLFRGAEPPIYPANCGHVRLVEPPAAAQLNSYGARILDVFRQFLKLHHLPLSDNFHECETFVGGVVFWCD